MSAGKHTVESWEINPVRTVEGEFMVCGGGTGHDYGLIATVITEDDACLISAAPDLLSVLEECNTFLDDLTKPDAKASGPAIIASYANAIALNMKIGKVLSQARKPDGGADV